MSSLFNADSNEALSGSSTRGPVDKTIEETFMKHSKSHGGTGGGGADLSGLLSNYDAYQRWVRAAY
jgi:hypothetical protein